MHTFTFGFCHTHPRTGEPLSHGYIQMPGDSDTATRLMVALFGQAWCSEYDSPEQAGLGQYPRMWEVPLPEADDEIQSDVAHIVRHMADELLREFMNTPGWREALEVAEWLDDEIPSDAERFLLRHLIAAIQHRLRMSLISAHAQDGRWRTDR